MAQDPDVEGFKTALEALCDQFNVDIEIGHQLIIKTRNQMIIDEEVVDAVASESEAPAEAEVVADAAAEAPAQEEAPAESAE